MLTQKLIAVAIELEDHLIAVSTELIPGSGHVDESERASVAVHVHTKGDGQGLGLCAPAEQHGHEKEGRCFHFCAL